MSPASIGYNEVGNDFVLSKKSSLVKGTDENKVVAPAANDTIIVPTAEANFEGVVAAIEDDGACSVQMRGFVTVTYSGTAPTVGQYQELVSNGTGGVKLPATPDDGNRHFFIHTVDAGASTVTFNLG